MKIKIESFSQDCRKLMIRVHEGPFDNKLFKGVSTNLVLPLFYGHFWPIDDHRMRELVKRVAEHKIDTNDADKELIADVNRHFGP